MGPREEMDGEIGEEGSRGAPSRSRGDDNKEDISTFKQIFLGLSELYEFEYLCFQV